MAYRLSKNFDTAQASTAKDTLRDGIKAQLSSTAIINNLKSEGLGYRRTNMLRDIRRARATEFSKDVDSGSRAVSWYDQVFEAFQEENNLSPQAASDLWRKTVEQSWDTLEEAELGVQWQDLYNDLFK